jgi:hypothetical protein
MLHAALHGACCETCDSDNSREHFWAWPQRRAMPFFSCIGTDPQRRPPPQKQKSPRQSLPGLHWFLYWAALSWVALYWVAPCQFLRRRATHTTPTAPRPSSTIEHGSGTGV